MSTLRPQLPSCALVAWGALLAALGGCRQEAPPSDLPPRAIQWERVSGSLAGDDVGFVLFGVCQAS